MINLNEFLNLAENTLIRHNRGNYSYLPEDCAICKKYAPVEKGNVIENCVICPLLSFESNCSDMGTYETYLRPEYWMNVIQEVKNIIDVHEKLNKPIEMSREELSKTLWKIDSELAE